MTMLETTNHVTNASLPCPDNDSTRVLLIDDDEDDAMIEQAMLTRVRGMTFDVEWASTYHEGLQMLKDNTHDICLLDYCLGKETGIHVLSEALKFGCHVPIIMVTGATDPEIDFQAIKLGAADYIIKGETNPGLLERVIRHARERRKTEIEREHLTQQLIENSRQLGMAEVATDVLHNIGNLLNSLNVSAGLLAQQFRDMPIRDVRRISDLLESHQQNLGTFLTEDTKGQRIPAFLAQLGNHLNEQYDQTCSNLDTLIAQIDHVKDIIAAQEELTGTVSIHEPVLLKELVEYALTINSPGLDNHHITIIRDYVDIPQVIIDKRQVLQILSHLIRNAIEAMRQQSHGPHTLTIRIKRHSEEENRIHIQVSDSGVGIRPENLQRIFAQSFTKPNQVPGPDLHSSALAAKNLGGLITAFSEGKGRGATFTLELPVKFLEIPT